MDALKAADITHFGIEASPTIQPNIYDFLEGQTDALSGVLISPVRSMKAIMAAAVRDGLKVVAVDVDQSGGHMSSEERDSGIADNILEMVQKLDTDATAAVLLGFFHNGLNTKS
jgi:hypothetical protein